ncbi:MAG: hypothetical protein IIA73_01285 [Proteobacteria bacterium]|nr:hypothetical protein [Pseudomonadota bacterium]
MAFEILQERTHKYGRNVTAAASVILVLAWVPGIEISEFEPFGFVIGDAPGGELSIWCLLTGILVYYFIRFSVSLRIDYLANSRFIRGYFKDLQTYKNDLQRGIERKDPSRIKNAKKNISGKTSDRVQVWQFYIFEAGMPVALFAFAAFAAYVEIGTLWY